MSTSRILSSTRLALATIVTLAGMTSSAFAADWLRGSFSGTHQVDWAGIYGGVHAGITSGQTNPRAMAEPLAQNALPGTVITNTVRDMLVFKETNKAGASFGGFVGMNWQWDDVVLGFEVDYTRANIRANSSISQTASVRPTGTTDEYAIQTNATSRARITDWATMRARAGFAMGIFMPFITGGVAFGNIDGRADVSGAWQRYDVSSGAPVPYPNPFFSGTFTGQVGRRGIAYGGVVGAGVDMQLFPNTFLRAEWQHVQFASGVQRPNVSLNTARVAGGVKF